MPTGVSSQSDSDTILGGLQNVTGAIITKIVKNKGLLTLEAEKDEDVSQDLLRAIDAELLKVDAEKKGLFKKTPCEEALARWDEDQGFKFSRAAGVDPLAWAEMAAEELRPWMKKQYMKRYSQHKRNEAKAKQPSAPLHKPSHTGKAGAVVKKVKVVKETDVAKKAEAVKKAARGQGGSTGVKDGKSDSPGSEQGVQGAPSQDSTKTQLVHRLAGMDEAVLNAILNAATQAQTLQLGSVTVTAPAGASIPITGAAKVEENEVEHSSEEDDEDEEDDDGAAKKANSTKVIKAKNGLKAKKAGKAKAMKAQKADVKPPGASVNLQKVTAKTDEYIKNLGLQCSGAYYYEKGGEFKINWTKGDHRGTARHAAKDKHDEVAQKNLHLKFHARAAAMK